MIKEMIEKYPSINLIGIDIRKMSMENVVYICHQAIKKREKILIGVVNAAKLVNSKKDTNLLASLKNTNFIVADGMAVVWLSRLCGNSLPKRVTGIDIMHNLLELADKNNYGVYFLGARQNIVEKVVEWSSENFPNIRIAGYHNGYFNETKEKEIAENIRNSKTDILFVAITSPKKENFLSKWNYILENSVCHGVGGSFDVIAGKVKRAPLWMQKAGIEWLYRVIQEPRRMWKRYLVTNAYFIIYGIKDIIRYRLGKCKKSASQL